MKFLLLLINFALAMDVHVHQMGEHFKPGQINSLRNSQFKVHPKNPKDLVLQELEFFDGLIIRAKLKDKLGSLTYMEKSKILDLLEAANYAQIEAEFQILNPQEIKELGREFYR